MKHRHVGAAITVMVSVLATSMAVPAATAATPGTPATPATSASATVVAGTWQTDGIVWSVAYAGNDVYIGGDFTSIRPPGTALGDPGTLAASHLAAFNRSTGQPDTAFLALGGADAVVDTLTASPDGTRLYAGGAFTTINGQPEQNIAALRVSDGTVDSTWAPAVNGTVRKVITSPDGATVYVGGDFGQANGKSRNHLAAFSASGTVNATQGLLAWRRGGKLDGSVRTLHYWQAQPGTMSPGDVVIVGGFFFHVDGQNSQYVTSMSADPSGQALRTTPTPPLWHFNNCLRGTYVADIADDGPTVYVGVGGFRIVPGQTYHCFEGIIAVDPVTMAQRGYLAADGDVQALAFVKGELYASGHFKNVSVGTSTTFTPRYHLFAVTPTNVPKSDGSMSTTFALDSAWTPKMNGKKGGWSQATDGTHLMFGGDFANINQKPQQGIVQFAMP